MLTRLLPTEESGNIYSVRPFSIQEDMRILGIWQFQEAYVNGLQDHIFFKGTTNYYRSFVRDKDHRLYTVTYAGLPIIIAELLPADETELLGWEQSSSRDLLVKLNVSVVHDFQNELYSGLTLILSEMWQQFPGRRIHLTAARYQESLINLLDWLSVPVITEIGIIRVYDAGGIQRP